MSSWKAGDIDELLSEGLTIQRRLATAKRNRYSEDEKLKRSFTKGMSKGNTKVALRLLSKDNRGSILHPNDTIPSSNGDHTSVLNVLKSKHPPGTI